MQKTHEMIVVGKGELKESTCGRQHYDLTVMPVEEYKTFKVRAKGKSAFMEAKLFASCEQSRHKVWECPHEGCPEAYLAENREKCDIGLKLKIGDKVLMSFSDSMSNYMELV